MVKSGKERYDKYVAKYDDWVYYLRLKALRSLMVKNYADYAYRSAEEDKVYELKRDEFYLQRHQRSRIRTYIKMLVRALSRKDTFTEEWVISELKRLGYPSNLIAQIYQFAYTTVKKKDYIKVSSGKALTKGL